MISTVLFPKVDFRLVCILVLLNIRISSSASNQYSDLRSHVHTNQPLVLVLDNYDHLRSINSKSHDRWRNVEDKGFSLPLLLKHLSQVNHKKFLKPRSHNHDHRKPRSRYSVDRKLKDQNDRYSLERHDDRVDKERDHEWNQNKDQRDSDRNENMNEKQIWYKSDWREDRDRREDRHRKDNRDRKDDRTEDRDRYDDRNSNGDQDRRVRSRKIPKSPVIKNLLRMSNSLRCGAKKQCQNECNNYYDGRKKHECEEECDKDISCEEEDGCGSDECAESEDDQTNVSTRGIEFTTATPGCKRC